MNEIITKNAIKICELSKFYGKFRALNGISLTVEDGEFFGFIGPNGAGKSTTIRILLGMLKASGGSARIFGADCWSEKVSVLKQVGYLPSESAFYQGMRVRDILKYSADLRRTDCKKTADELCERLQLDPVKKADELSFGNRKKVAIVCALQHDPRLLILDEPTGGLDPLMQREFFDIIEERSRKGATVFMSSHVLSEVQNHCDRAAIIKNGSIIACDKVDDLKRTSVKRVSLTGQIDTSSLPPLKNVTAAADHMSFLYDGDLGRLLAVLSAGQVKDIEIHEPDLEEVFLHYYETEGEK